MPKSKETILGLLMLAPWWVSVVASGISYVTLKYIIPAIEFQQKSPADVSYMLFKGLVNAAPLLAPLIALILLIPAPFSALNTKRNRKKTTRLHSRISPSSKTKTAKIEPPDFGENSLMNDLAAIEFPYTDEVERYAIKPEDKNVDLSIETLKIIEWYSFELLCKIYYESIGFRVIKTKAGADGGIDLLLYISNTEKPFAIVQCKARTYRDIGVNYARELLGVMTSEKVGKGILITNSGFTKEAYDFANNHQIELIDVSILSEMFASLDVDKKKILIDFLKSFDFTTPTCPNCEVKLVERTAKKGKDIGQKFWGCLNYPKCRYKLPMHENVDRKFRNKILENQSVPVFSTEKVDSAIISEEHKQEQSENNEPVIDIRIKTDPHTKEVLYQVKEDKQDDDLRFAPPGYKQ
jgi:restriction system protein